MNRRYIAFAFIPVIVAVAAAWILARSASQPSSGIPTPSVIIGGQVVRVDLATTAAERAQGLSGREGLAADEGMLFVFTQDGDYSFWMKDMRFAIDIVWIDAQGAVVTIQRAVSPSTYPSSFAPTAPSRYVLELPSGYAAAHGIAEGALATWGDGTPLSVRFAK